MGSLTGSSTDGRVAVSLDDSPPRRQDTSPEDLSSHKQGAVAQPQPDNSVLILRWDDSGIDDFVRFVEKHGFDVHCAKGSAESSAAAEYGAIVHLARSDKDLRIHLGDFHCTFQLTQRASSDLRAFVHWLWAIGSVA